MDNQHGLPSTPSRRPDLPPRSLSLHLPSRNPPGEASPLALPASPQLELQNVFVQSHSRLHSPATVLPRHSRGLDFSRACTNLHHSTLPDHSSPDSSPIITQKLAIPGRRSSISSTGLESPYVGGPGTFPWGSLAHERSAISSSVGSTNAITSDTESSDSDGDASMGGEDNEDPLFSTPQVRKLQNPNAPTPFHGPNPASFGNLWGSGNATHANGHMSPAQSSLMKVIRRTRLHKASRNRHSSGSFGGGAGGLAISPRTISPPPLRSIETATPGYFPWPNSARSRRESLVIANDSLQLSTSNDSGDELTGSAGLIPGVVKRPVTRRSNLLPKTKGFARIRAALAEEAAPVDSEVRREAETIRQVRERDDSIAEPDLLLDQPQSVTAASSPNLLPAVSEVAQDDFCKELQSDLPPSTAHRVSGLNFAAHVNRNSGGLEYWNRFDSSMRTPPPNFARQSSSGASDNYMDITAGEGSLWRRPRTRARSSASDASEAFPAGVGATGAAGVNDDVHLKKFKRRREDDFDVATIKRRAVSPGMSVQNSPTLANSPLYREATSSWSQAPERKERKDAIASSSESPLPNSYVNSQGTRSGSVSSSVGPASTGTSYQGKKLGLQPMSDTNEGLMKMSIE